jgi:acetate kinase
MKVLVLNCGSSSLKFLLIDTAAPGRGPLASGQVERIGGQGLLSWHDAAGELLGAGVPQVAVFDTAFHATMPEASYMYAIPYQYYRRHRIRRYGFHGSSHQYLAGRYAPLAGIAPDEVNIITLHLGNGCSACAIRGGESFTTSMGFTPLEGLVVGTRSGDVDPSLVEFLMSKEGMSVHEVDAMLNRHSGLLGLSGLTGDMRDLLAEEAEHRDRRVTLAIDVFCRRVRHYIGAFFAERGGADAVVFSGGIDENVPAIRARVCDGLACLGLHLDASRKAALALGGEGCISAGRAALAAWVIPTDEELLIARETARVLG